MEELKIFDVRFASFLTCEIKTIQLEGSNEDEDILVKPEWQSTKQSMSCSYCRVEFSEPSQHREHYKLDWHRYNLKQHLLARDAIGEEEFNEKTDDLSSISGSESEKEDTLDTMAMSQGKLFLKSNDVGKTKIFSLYRALLADRKVEIGTDLTRQLRNVSENKKWVVLMLGGGHFAGAVFDGVEPILHKTFHCYTVRAGQGGTQSSKDNKSATSTSKSAGASLRRYNEATFVQHVTDIITNWKREIASSALIVCRAAGPYNRGVLFGGKTPLIDRTDRRIRTVPFSTRRATFTEVKRVHEILSNVQVYDDLETATKQFTKFKTPEEPKRNKIKNPSINRAKSREITERALPARISTSEDDTKDVEYVTEQVTINLKENLDDFSEKTKIKKKCKKSKSKKLQEQETLRKTEIICSIKFGDLLKLETQLEDKFDEVLDEQGNTPLHLAALSEQEKVLVYLLKNEADLCKKNVKQQTPYTCTQNKETREFFKSYAVANPNKYNYNKANIPLPPSGLTAEEIAEKKRALRKVKREKEKEKRKEKDVVRKEQDEQERFKNLSDREKRALAAERRILNSSGAITARCFLCGADISGKVPFEYLENRFCSIVCLKAHRMKTPIVLS